MKTCQQCESTRLATISAKCSDMCSAGVQGGWSQEEGYVPSRMGIGSGEYIEIEWCLNCGQIRGKWPMQKTGFEDLFGDPPGDSAYWIDEDGEEMYEPKEGEAPEEEEEE